MYNNSDGYIFIDLKGVDISKTNQYLKGIFNRVITVIDVNKLAIVINAGDLTPMAAIVRKRLNYYVITTNLYIFTINSNDIIIIEEAGETTVDVSIVPTLLSGIKVADFSIGATEGSIYVPEQQTEINDNTVSDHTTWSSDKINTELSGKADSSDLATVATTGSYDDLTNKPTIPTKVSELQNDSGYVTGSSLATVATTGSYDDLTNKPTIPTKVSELQNDSSYATTTELSNGLATKQDKIPDTVAKTVTFDVANSGGDVKAKVYNRVLYISGYFRFSSNQSANTQLLHVSDVTLAMDYFESCYTDGSSTVRFKLTNDGKLINENQFQANQWVSISLTCLLA